MKRSSSSAPHAMAHLLGVLLLSLPLFGCRPDASPSSEPQQASRTSESRPAMHPKQTPPAEPLAPRSEPLLRELPEPLASVSVEGARLAVPGHLLRTLALYDGDRDGDRDVLAIASPERGIWSIWFSRRQGERFEPPERLGLLGPEDPACHTAETTWRVVSARIQVVARHRCPRGEVRSLALLTWRETPRWEERVDAEPPSPARPWTIRLEGDPTQDEDEDGHPDWAVTVTLQPADTQPQRTVAPLRLRLLWLDRPAGLAPRPGAVAELLRAGVREADSLRREDPARAARLEQALLEAHDALCRQGPGARLLVSGVRGLPCPQADALLPRLAARLVMDLLSSGDWESALGTEEALLRRGLHAPEGWRQRLRAAWQRAAEPLVRWRPLPLPAPAPPAGPDAPAIFGFLDERTLRICVSPLEPPRFLTLAGEPATPPPRTAPCSGPLSDPSGRWGARPPTRDCQGHLVEIVDLGSAERLVQARLRIEQRSAPPGTGCPERPLPPHLARDTGGWRLLGWTPQGLLAARGDEVRVLPITEAGLPAGEALPLAGSQPLPAPIHPAGPVAPDGTATVRVTRRGVWLHPRRRGARPRLLRPRSWDEASLPVAAAVGPGGSPVLVVREGRIWQVEEDAERGSVAAEATDPSLPSLPVPARPGAPDGR